jgi:hypothetical protein
MIDQEVTDVTRNDKYVEVKLLLDVALWAASLYLLTHPDGFDRIGNFARGSWRSMIHTLSVWTARQDIRSLPEIQED